AVGHTVGVRVRDQGAEVTHRVDVAAGHVAPEAVEGQGVWAAVEELPRDGRAGQLEPRAGGRVPRPRGDVTGVSGRGARSTDAGFGPPYTHLRPPPRGQLATTDKPSMKAWALDYLCCPQTRSPLTLKDEQREGEEIVGGRLVSAEGREYPIAHGVPRLTLEHVSDAEAATIDAFGKQWDAFSSFDGYM